jgi:LacI family transcriptional regulator
MNKKITIYDVARRAGVAISTVSRVLNQSPYVSDATRKKVDKAIQDLEFYPQVNARKLASKQPQIIAVAVPTFTTPFFNEVLKGLKDEIQDMDLDFIIFNTGSQNSTENLRGFLDRGTPDALIILSIALDDYLLNRLRKMHIPVVLVDLDYPEFDVIKWDNYKGGWMAGEHLVDCGYREIGMIQSHRNARINEVREQGFKDALAKHGITLNEKYIASGISTKHAGFSEEAGYEAVKILHEKGALPEALFCSNDAQAIGAMKALRELEVRIPRDIGLIGYDNIKTSRFLGLSTIDQKMAQVGSMAVKRMAELIYTKEKNPSKIQVVIEPQLIARESTRKRNA